MRYRKFGRTNLQVSEIGHGMWGLADWQGSDASSVERALDRSVELGCNFFDTAWAYGNGLSEQILAKLLKRHRGKDLITATKIPAMNFKWPAKRDYKLKDCYPVSHIIAYTEKSLRNLQTDCIDLQQFHVWTDEWASNDEWKEAVQKLKKEGKIRFMGISINRWEPDNALDTVRTSMIDAIQVIYNIFDQAPEDHLFPLCREMEIGVIARVPFDEGSLTGTLSRETTFPPNDWRSTYFVPENLIASVEHADALKPLVPVGMTIPEMALRFILCNSDVHTIIPGMRSVRHVESNIATSDGHSLAADLLKSLRAHRWDRQPTSWSQ